MCSHKKPTSAGNSHSQGPPPACEPESAELVFVRWPNLFPSVFCSWPLGCFSILHFKSISLEVRLSDVNTHTHQHLHPHPHQHAYINENHNTSRRVQGGRQALILWLPPKLGMSLFGAHFWDRMGTSKWALFFMVCAAFLGRTNMTT